MEIISIAALSFGLAGLTFALACTILERNISSKGIDAITSTHIGARLLVMSGVMGAGAVFITLGAVLASA